MFLAEELDHLDFFIRPVNIHDNDIKEINHDVNKFYASLSNITKHVQAGLTSLSQLDNVLKMAQIIAGGKEQLRQNPIISFITCVIKSPLEMVDDTTQKLIEIVRRDMPVVISSSPQGGSTAPIEEAGLVAQINAEILCGIVLSQLVKSQAQVLYGSVPVRARMDNLHDMYAAPEFNHYNIACIEMARYYKIPCYSTAGVADASRPGVAASVEKLFTHLPIAMAGAQYIHYAFGLLDRTNTFCPVQAVLDNQHIGMIKWLLDAPRINETSIAEALEQIAKVMGSKQRLFVRHLRKSLKAGLVCPHYPFESKTGHDEAINLAHSRMEALLSRQPKRLPKEMEDEIFNAVKGIVPRLRHSGNELKHSDE
ncbi:Trimethylamine methyltransferase [Candidatus Magnetoovum chiemensis]|nr:Trimethylamine methyltransferase [Candidatus Magnetoovum chiemensis]